MTRRRREDHPLAWHHVFNRGIAKRALFETAVDVDRFLDLIGRSVTDGQIEVHAYCLMTTHFHILLRSLTGELSAALRAIENTYVRAFNVGRRRDGPLVRGRFRSRRIDDSAYWETVVRYIDRNPVAAGICALPSDYPHGSAQAYRWKRGPDWITRSLVEAVVTEAMSTPAFDPATYDAWSMSARQETIRALIDARAPERPGPLRYDDLVRGAPVREQAWMQFKARLADGTRLGSVLLSPETVKRHVARRRRMRPALRTQRHAVPGSLWDVLEAGLLHTACGLTQRRVGELLGRPRTTVASRCEGYRHQIAANPRFCQVATNIVRRCLDDDLPPLRSSLHLPVRVPTLET